MEGGGQGRVVWRLSAASLSLMLRLRLAEKPPSPTGVHSESEPSATSGLGWARLGWVGLGCAGFR